MTLIFLRFFGKNTCQDFSKKSKKSKILARNGKNPRSFLEIQDYPRISKILAKRLRRQALRKHWLFNKFKKRKTKAFNKKHVDHHFLNTDEYFFSQIVENLLNEILYIYQAILYMVYCYFCIAIFECITDCSTSFRSAQTNFA